MDSHPRPCPAVSVVMAVLNPHREYFRDAVQSIVAQSLENWELIIVEDPSSSCAQPALSRIGDGRIRHHVNSRRTSLVAQRNLALALARAPLLASFDADDLAEPTRLECQLQYLQGHPEVGLVGTQVCVIDGVGKPRGCRSFPLDHDSILKALPSTVAICQGSCMFRKPLVAQVGGYQYSEQNTVEDYDLFSRLALAGVRFANLPETLLRYRFHRDQLKATRLRNTIRGILHVKRRYWRYRMTWRDKVQMWAERSLLWLPSPLVFRLVERILYSDDMPETRPFHVDEPQAPAREGLVEAS
jgi:glycosyltransferase involved in cell wall biosynthesis